MNRRLDLAPRWRIAVFLFFAAGLNYADRAALSSVIPPLRDELGATDVDLGIAGLLFLWSYALASPFAGALADRCSRSRIVSWSLTAWSLITLLTGFARNVETIFVLRAGLGLAESFYLPAAVALLGEHHGASTRGKAMSLQIAGLNVGFLFGGSFAGLLAEQHGWRWGFWLLGGAGILLALGSRAILRDLPAGASQGPRERPTTAVKETAAYLLRVPSFHALLASAMTAGVAAWVFSSWLPLYFSENYGLNLAAAGFAGVMLMQGPGLLGILLGGWISDRAARRAVRNRALIKALSFLLSGPILVFFWGTLGFASVATVLVIASLIRASGTPSEHAIICDVVPLQFRSTATGILNTCGTAAGGLGVLVASLLKKEFGLNMIFGASSGLFIVAGLAMLWAYSSFMSADEARARAHEKNAVGE